MPSISALKKKRIRLIGKVSDNLDFLIGSVSTKGLKYEAYNLTATVTYKPNPQQWLLPEQILPTSN